MAGQFDSNTAPEGTVHAGVPAPYGSMASFVAALREGERPAVRAFYLLYTPMLQRQARRMSVPEDERATLVTTVLGDVLLHIVDADLPPRDLARYVVGSLRNRARNGHRDHERQAAREERAYTSTGAGGQRIVAECHSEYGVRAARPVDAVDAPRFSSAIDKLARWSAQAIGSVDAGLMIGISHHVPLRDLAEQAGIGYGAARVRVHRLRERLPALTREYVATLDDAERVELERFFRRAGVALHEAEHRARSPRPRGAPPSARRDGGDDDA